MAPFAEKEESTAEAIRWRRPLSWWDGLSAVDRQGRLSHPRMIGMLAVRPAPLSDLRDLCGELLGKMVS